MRKIALFVLFVLGISTYAEQKGPEISAEAAMTIDVDSNEIIYAKNVDRRMYPASITKLLTAILLAENRQRDDLLIYSSVAKEAYPYTLDLAAGDKLSADAAMDGLLLYSGNDIAVMIAENISSGSTEKFAGLMNGKAKDLKLENSHFMNPSGLHDIDHYSSAYDLSVVARVLYNYPWIIETIGKKESTLVTAGRVSIHVKNRNKLTGLDGCIGGKTGYTGQAGRCLLALYERDGRRIVGVVLNSEYNPADTVVFETMETLINWSYSTPRETLLARDVSFLRETVEYRLFPFIGPVRNLTLPLVLKEDISIYMTGEKYSLQYEKGALSPWELKENKPVGMLKLKQRDKAETFPVYSPVSWQDLIATNIGFYLKTVTGLFFIFSLSFSLTHIRRI